MYIYGHLEYRFVFCHLNELVQNICNSIVHGAWYRNYFCITEGQGCDSVYDDIV